ncbi:NmrA domain-containing protein [Mycena kentingensis (nom. inval.)]|nr:NmrA domain-containing protein [Mycena kentingensis (nom. inval.)]
MTITDTPTAPLVAVVGATGMQGGSVIAALEASDRAYRIRGFTRDATKPAAEALKARGVEVVQVALTVENKEQVFEVFKGAHYAFLVTNFWEHCNVDKEIAEGKLLVDAAAASGCSIIWSGLPSPSAASSGKYTKVYHFDGKAQVTAYGKSLSAPFACIPAGFYMQNYLAHEGPMRFIHPAGEGKYTITTNMRPEALLPMIDIVGDYGYFVRRAIEAKVFPTGETVNTASEMISSADIAKTISEVTGKDVTFVQITHKAFAQVISKAGLPDVIAEELAQGYEYFNAPGYYGGEPVASTKGLAKPVATFKQFVEAADWSKCFV